MDMLKSCVGILACLLVNANFNTGASVGELKNCDNIKMLHGINVKKNPQHLFFCGAAAYCGPIPPHSRGF